MGSPTISLTITHDPETVTPVSSPPTFSLVIQITKLIDPGQLQHVLSGVENSLGMYIEALRL